MKHTQERVCKNKYWFIKAAFIYSITTIPIFGIAYSASAKDKEIPQEIDIIILEDNQEKKAPVTVDLVRDAPELNYSLSLPRTTDQQLANALKSFTVNKNLQLTIDTFRGEPVAQLPISIPPGTNGIQPELGIQVKVPSSTNQFTNGLSIGGAAPIQKCNDKKDLCLGSHKRNPLYAGCGSSSSHHSRTRRLPPWQG